MNAFNGLFLFALSITILSCGNGAGTSSDFSLVFPEDNTNYQLGQTLEVSLHNKKEKEYDSVVYYLDSERLGKVSAPEPFTFTLQDVKLGDWELRARIYSGTSEE